MSLIGPESLHPAQHPVVMFALLGLAHVIGGPALVPGAPLLPLPGADQRVGLEGEQQLVRIKAHHHLLSLLPA